jgi:hypothetical protein
MRNALPAVAAIATLTALAGCGRGLHISRHTDVDDDAGPMKVVTTLVCPEHQGDLTRVRTAPDGASCDYAGPRGAQVTLSLVKLSNGQTPDAALKPLEGQLDALMPDAMSRLAKGDSSAHAGADAADAAADKAEDAADKAQDEADKAKDKAEAAADAVDGKHRHGDADVTMPGVSVKSKDDTASVRMPGIKIDSNNGGAHISIGGVHIDADDKKDGHQSSHVNISSDNGEVSVNAQDHAAQIREHHKGQGLRMTYVLVDDQASANGWRLVGYEARGPQGGPLVVAVVKSSDRHEDEVFHAAKALVKKNVGG